MYGLVNSAVQELVCSKFGKDRWDEIRKRAGLDIEFFSRMSPYPDDLTYRLVGAASEVLDLPPDKVLEAFGEFWVLYTGKEGYGHLFSIAGNSLKDFLYNLDNLHTRVGQNFPQLQPPSFQFDDLGDSRLRMHYYSDRTGLCPMVFGLVRGLAERFHTDLSVEHTECQRQGADHCEFILTLGAPRG